MGFSLQKRLKNFFLKSGVTRESHFLNLLLLPFLLLSAGLMVFYTMQEKLWIKHPLNLAFGWLTFALIVLSFILNRTRFYIVGIKLFLYGVTISILVSLFITQNHAGVLIIFAFLSVLLLIASILLTCSDFVFQSAFTIIPVAAFVLIVEVDDRPHLLMGAGAFLMHTLILIIIKKILEEEQLHREKTQKELTEKKVKLELSEQIAHLNKLSAIGEISSGIIHEIKNPLTHILLKSEKFTEKLHSPSAINAEETDQYVEQMVELAHRINRIVETMQSYVWGGKRTHAKDVRVKDILHSTHHMVVDRIIREDIELNMPKVPENLIIFARDIEISQVLINLIFNSVDAIKFKSNRWINITVQALGSYVEFTITDAGPGIEASIRQKMLEPFFTTKKPGEGTGLGLSICRRIIEEHQGKLYLDPDCPNTRFIFTVPIKSTAA